MKTEQIIAVILAAVTLPIILLPLAAAVRAARKRQQENGMIPEKKPVKQDCKLNEIMGYEFITIQTVKETERILPKEDVSENIPSFADSVGIGMTEIITSTGRGDYENDYEPDEMPTEDEKPSMIKISRPRRTEKRIDKRTEEPKETNETNDGIEYPTLSSREMEALIASESIDWPETEPDTDNWNGHDIDYEDSENTPEKTEDKEKYDEIVDRSNDLMKEIYRTMQDSSTTEEEDKLVEMLTNINSDIQKEMDNHQEKITEDDIPDID